MTNKEKYPNAEVRSLDDKYYVSLDGISYYLVDGKPNKDCTEGWFKTRKEAQTTLDNFMNGPKQEITLSEIKSQYEEAKKLIGNKIKGLVVKDVSLHVELRLSSYVCNEFFEKNGYVIKVSDGKGTAIPYTPDISIFKDVSVKAHDGQTYTAESDRDCWKFGCARISKSLIKNASELFEKSVTGNRQIQKITIGACDFDRETLKSLVELENS